MLLNFPARTVLFLSSYAPLFLIYTILYFGVNDLISFVSLGIAVLSVALAVLLLKGLKSYMSADTRTIDQISQDGSQVMGYVASYLVPFVGVSLLELRQVLALVVYLIILGYLYTTTSMVYMNPTLQVLFGYRVYDVTFDGGYQARLIALHQLKKKDTVAAIKIGHSLMIQKDV